MFAVTVCVPSLSKQVERPVASSDHVAAAAELEIAVPVTGEGAKLLLVKLNVPLLNGIYILPYVSRRWFVLSLTHGALDVGNRPQALRTVGPVLFHRPARVPAEKTPSRRQAQALPVLLVEGLNH